MTPPFMPYAEFGKRTMKRSSAVYAICRIREADLWFSVDEAKLRPPEAVSLPRRLQERVSQLQNLKARWEAYQDAKKPLEPRTKLPAPPGLAPDPKLNPSPSPKP